MRYIVSSFMGLLICGSAVAQQPFTLSGNLSKIQSPVSKVYLSYYANGESHRDSTELKNGSFQFTGNIDQAVLANLSVRLKDESGSGTKPVNMRRDAYGVFLEPGAAITVSSVDSVANSSVKGSLAHADYEKLKAKNKALEAEMQAQLAMYSEYNKAKNAEGMKQVEKTYDSLDLLVKGNYKAFLKENPATPIAMFSLDRFAGYDIDPAEVEPVFLGLSEANRNSKAGVAMAEKIATAKKTSVGALAMDFTQNDTLGNPVSLSSFKGKYVLIDFWASWCGPCRRENPNVVDAFSKYSSRGFTVLGVSLDQPNAKEKWLKAIHDDKLNWTHVSDLKYWKNEVAIQYGIQAIPQNFLVDPQGTIIGKNLRGEALQKKLAELFN